MDLIAGSGVMYMLAFSGPVEARVSWQSDHGTPGRSGRHVAG